MNLESGEPPRPFVHKAQWLLALVVSLAPRRVWPRLEPPLPLRGAATWSGLITVFGGSLLGILGFVRYAVAVTEARTRLLLHTADQGQSALTDALSLATPGLSMLLPFEFALATPTGLCATYLTLTGAFRTLCAAFDDARGDPTLSGLDLLVSRRVASRRARREHDARETREGPRVADILATGAWAGLDADYVVIASRRKAEWDAGAIILTKDEWYRLGSPSEMEWHGRLRTLYPLTRLETVEVVRRGIEYDLPPLSPKYSKPRDAGGPQAHNVRGKS